MLGGCEFYYDATIETFVHTCHDNQSPLYYDNWEKNTYPMGKCVLKWRNQVKR